MYGCECVTLTTDKQHATGKQGGGATGIIILHKDYCEDGVSSREGEEYNELEYATWRGREM